MLVFVRGFVSRRLARCGTQARPEPMADQVGARIVQTRAPATGYDRAEYAGHSLRVWLSGQGEGFHCQNERGSRHKSLDVLAGYVRDAEAFIDHAGEDFA